MDRPSLSDLHRRRGRLAILGNGPSLRGFDFGRLSGVDSLGMNAAYRYWDRIAWYPTHYACLDDALIETHKHEIRRLVDEERIETFFLSGSILETFPELANHDRMRFLDEHVPYWFETRGQKHGLEFRQSPAFQTGAPDFLTTGAYSLRYGVDLGYDRIGLLGIDLRYMDLDVAKPTSDNSIQLRMSATPRENPNYFFDDYQREGDLFHVPNPAVFKGDLHVGAFEAARDDFSCNRVHSKVFNCNLDSALADRVIFPYQALTSFLNEPQVATIAVPFTSGEQHALMDMLWLWSLPAFCPRLSLGRRTEAAPKLVFVCNNSAAVTIADRARDFIAQEPALADVFSQVNILNLNLSGDADLYQRENQGDRKPFGWRAGPNNLFFGMIEAVRQNGGATLYIETDCVPLRGGWLDQINSCLSGSEGFWIIGSIYRGRDPLGKRESRHINGNAIYATGNPDFVDFVTGVWKPWLESRVEARQELAFDCALEDFFDKAESLLPDDSEPWKMLQKIAHKFRYSSLIANLATVQDAPHDLAKAIRRLFKSDPEVCFAHSRTLAKAISHLRLSDGRTDVEALLAILEKQHQPERISAPVPIPVDRRFHARLRRLMARILRRLLRIVGAR